MLSIKQEIRTNRVEVIGKIILISYDKGLLDK